MKHIIDAHCHIYPNKIAMKAVRSIDDFYEGLPSEPYDGTRDMLLVTGEDAGIEHFVVFSVATTPHQVSSINRFIANNVAESGGKFTGLGTMHLDSDDYERDLQEAVDLGLKGIKLHPDVQDFNLDDPRAMRIYGMLEERGLPVYVHTGDFRYDRSNPDRVVNVLKAFPKLKFVGPHFGGWSVWEDALKMLPEFPNITVDTSSSLYALKPAMAKELIRAYGSERVMFGTDYPMWHQQPEFEWLERLELTDDEYENIYWRTCSNLLDITL